MPRFPPANDPAWSRPPPAARPAKLPLPPDSAAPPQLSLHEDQLPKKDHDTMTVVNLQNNNIGDAGKEELRKVTATQAALRLLL